MCEGLVPVRTMSMDYFDFDEPRHMLIGRRTGWRFRLGQKLRVQLVRSEVEDGKLEFGMVRDEKLLERRQVKRSKPSFQRARKVLRKPRNARRKGRRK